MTPQTLDRGLTYFIVIIAVVTVAIWSVDLWRTW